MADKKITDLTALTTLADGDLLVVVDVSDTTDAATGTNKKIAKSDLKTDIFTSPTLVTPNIGVATGTTLSLTADSNQIVLDSDGTTTTITDSATSNRVITLPDLTTTLVGTSETSATDNSIVRMDGTTGRLIQGTGSASTINDSGTMSTSFYVATSDGITSFASFSFSGDNDTGFWSPANNTAGILAGGVEGLRVNTATTGVNYLDITPSAAGSAVTIATAGTDTDINLLLAPKGTSGLITSKTFIPSANDGAGLGTASNSFSDLFLASGALLNFANGNSVITHSSGILTVSTGDLRVTTAGTNTASAVTVGGTQTLTSKTLTAPVINAFTGTGNGVVTGNFTTTGTTTLATSLTGVLRADSGVVSVDVADALGYVLTSASSSAAANVDSTTYYFGMSGFTTGTTAELRQFIVPKTGTIKAVYFRVNPSGGTAGSSETSSISLRLNGATDTLITDQFQTDQALNTAETFSNTSLSIAVSAGDVFEFKWVTPAWATNPAYTSYIIVSSIYIE